MVRFLIRLGLLSLLACHKLLAIEDVPTSSYNETAPTSSDIQNWQTGWVQPAVQPPGTTYTTGWNYVGTIGQASGTYLGNGWVITAAHVGAANFVLAGTTYPMVPNSTQSFTSTTGTTTAPVDMVIFQVSPAPALPALPLRATDPVADGSYVVMTGYGDGASMTNETWGYNLVTEINQLLTPEGGPWITNDFVTLTGAASNGHHATGNYYQVVSGDSGGGDFIFNSTSGHWELAGINEVNGGVTYPNGSTQNFSGFVQLDTYAAEIEATITPSVDTPTLPAWAMILLGATLFLVAAPFLSVRSVAAAIFLADQTQVRPRAARRDRFCAAPR
jgi:hypothetical protein